MDKAKRYIPYLLLTGLTLFFCLDICGRYGIFGAKVDWLSQHSVLPDYFGSSFMQPESYFPNLRRIWAAARIFTILLITDYIVR